MTIFQCSQCPDRKFTSEFGLQNHCRAKRHPFYRYYCAVCQRKFGSADSLDQHRQDSPAHLAERMQHCSLCYRSFRTVRGLDDHIAAVHKRWYKKHNFNCLLCPNTFKSPSAIAHHLESQSHGINRHQVTAAVQALDIIPTISLRPRIEAASALSESPPEIIHYFATPQAFNGFAYECHICHRTFRSIFSLTTHLNSAAHDDDQFKCPRCKKHFKLISALIQHIESGCCGLAQLQQIAHHFHALTSRFSRALQF